MAKKHRRRRDADEDAEEPEEAADFNADVCDRLDALIEIGEDQIDLLEAVDDKLGEVLTRSDHLRAALEGLGDGGGILGKLFGKK